MLLSAVAGISIGVRSQGGGKGRRKARLVYCSWDVVCSGKRTKKKLSATRAGRCGCSDQERAWLGSGWMLGLICPIRVVDSIIDDDNDWDDGQVQYRTCRLSLSSNGIARYNHSTFLTLCFCPYHLHIHSLQRSRDSEDMYLRYGQGHLQETTVVGGKQRSSPAPIIGGPGSTSR